MVDAELDTEDEIVEIVGTVFVADEELMGKGVLGIDTDDEEIFLVEDDLDEDMRSLEGEVITARGSLWTDDEGNSWLYLQGFEPTVD